MMRLQIDTHYLKSPIYMEDLETMTTFVAEQRRTALIQSTMCETIADTLEMIRHYKNIDARIVKHLEQHLNVSMCQFWGSMSIQYGVKTLTLYWRPADNRRYDLLFRITNNIQTMSDLIGHIRAAETYRMTLDLMSKYEAHMQDLINTEMILRDMLMKFENVRSAALTTWLGQESPYIPDEIKKHLIALSA